MANTISFISNNWADIIAVAAALHGLALVIVNLTPSKTDDKVYNKLYKFVEIMAGIVTKMAKK